MARLADAMPIEQLPRRWIVSDDPQHVAAEVKRYTDAGFTHLVFHPRARPGSIALVVR